MFKRQIGISGTGFISIGLARLIGQSEDMKVSRVLTRRNISGVDHPCAGLLTGEIERLVAESDLVVECSGDALWGTEVVEAAMAAGKPVVTMNSELQITTGSHFAAQGGYFSEAEGDQPGSLAALRERVLDMGFEPLVYGNIKGFLNPDPGEEEMRYWAAKSGISLSAVTQFTDGTKINIEQVLVANGLGAQIRPQGMAGLACDSLDEGSVALAGMACAQGAPVSDYILCAKAPAGVFISARHDAAHAMALRYLKMGQGDVYTLLTPYHLTFFEIPKTLRRALAGGRVLLNNGVSPRYGVAACAKVDIAEGQTISQAIGGFILRGEAVSLRADPEHVPIALLQGATLKRQVMRGERLRFADVELPKSRALALWQATAKTAEGLAAHPVLIQ
ncbi:hypothetical protein [Craterilacuibacter sp.]|uniref:hypothetical protein n=1 Tax=Craterilacuibacter sp. TaxID=2870909 RepID=UPI003F2E3045